MHEGGEGPMAEIWETMTEEQKRKLIAMKTGNEITMDGNESRRNAKDD